jgi:hypothetical protein
MQMGLRPLRESDCPSVILLELATKPSVAAPLARLAKQQPVWSRGQVAFPAELPVDLRPLPVVHGFRNSDPGPMSALVLVSQSARAKRMPPAWRSRPEQAPQL